MASVLTKPRVRLLAIAVVLFFLIAGILFSGFSIRKMESPTMAPIIFGNGLQPGKGDLLLIANTYPRSWLRAGDLVFVDIPAGDQRTTTVRVITSISQPQGPKDRQFYIKGLTTNAIDSDTIGFLHQSNVLGKVVWVFHRTR